MRVLYLCPLGKQHQMWRLQAAPPDVHVVILRPQETPHEVVRAHLRNVDVLITERSALVDRALIEASPQLKLIQRIGAFHHDIDLEAARERGIAVCVRPIYGAIAVAEHVILQILALLRRAMPLQAVLRVPPETFLPGGPRRTDEDVFAFNWSKQTHIALLYNKTVGILGFGEIGAELAKRLQPWQCRVLYHKRHPLPTHLEAELGVEFRDAEALLRESDIVVCLLPYSAETDLWLNAERLALMKRGAWLVEAGSGSVVDERAVADAVRNGHLAGASFDTYEWEPISSDNPLLRLVEQEPSANVFLLPHVGSCNDIAENEFAAFYENVVRLIRGEPLVGRVA
ncbi:MAG: NAD(P)-dependent oxidoreductase [Anaerolineae bacterium]|nr:NAD(P)-binding domain-containing protein [Thermoflexales bacterium]MDW8292282.1 NAD(P)-dependent oxidoreductase [Anaerolineae bacterium]